MHGTLLLKKLALRPLTALILITATTAISNAQVALDSPAAAGKRMVREVAIVFKGAATLDSNRVRAQMATRIGEPYTDESVERDIRNLYATGAVENVDIQAVVPSASLVSRATRCSATASFAMRSKSRSVIPWMTQS
jgi:outer membrane protein insertion porin family